MSSDLAKSAALANSNTFRDLVRAAVIEHAITGVGISVAPKTKDEALAARAFYDADSVIRSFLWACADDSVISTAATPAEVPEDDIRRVIAATWTDAAAAVPNLGV